MSKKIKKMEFLINYFRFKHIIIFNFKWEIVIQFNPFISILSLH